jgi:transcriptional regulator with XRE-family HTH domain
MSGNLTSMKIGNKIKKIRELKNYTQEYMAQSLNISLNGYGRLERDEVEITVNRLEEIAKILEMDLLQVLGFDENRIFNISYSHNHNHNQNNHALAIIQNDEGFKMLITHLQEENKDLRSQINRLLNLLEKK